MIDSKCKPFLLINHEKQTQVYAGDPKRLVVWKVFSIFVVVEKVPARKGFEPVGRHVRYRKILFLKDTAV